MSTPLPDPVNVPLPVPPNAPLPALAGQITLALTALAAVVAFIWHKDFSSLVPALATLSVAVVGAALAIEHTIKYRTYTQAAMAYNHQLLDRAYALMAKPGDLIARTISP